MKTLPTRLQEILVVVWPLGVSAFLTELGYLLSIRVPSWIGLGVVVILPSLVATILLYRFIAGSNRFRLPITIVYGLSALVALPYVSLMVAAAHGDAL